MASRERKHLAIAWLVFAVLVGGLLDAGLRHDEARALERRAATTGLTASDAIPAARMLYTDEADPQRYFAYGRAILGRPASGYYIRSEAAWREEFDTGAAADPDAVPDVVPAGPLVPYRDFAVEYPPLIFPLVVPLAAVCGDADAFRVAFGVEMALVLAGAVLLALRLRRELPALPALTAPRVVAWTAVAAVLLGVVVTHRFDNVVGLLLIAAVVAALADRPVWTGIALGAAVGMKLVPAVAAPILALRWAQARRWGALASAIAAGTVTVIVTLGPMFVFDAGGLSALLRYHGARPLQVESTWAAALRLIDGSDLTVVHSYGSINAVGGHAAGALAIMPVALLAGLGAVIWLSARRRDDALGLVRGTLATLAVCMVLGKVFSPQYLLWLLPLAVPVALVDGRRSIAALCTILLASQIIYPIGNPALQHGATWVSAIVLARNLGLLAWTVVPLLGRRDRRA